jgi:hypothetical protein
VRLIIVMGRKQKGVPLLRKIMCRVLEKEKGPLMD